MYKVFFNESSVIIDSEFKKSNDKLSKSVCEIRYQTANQLIEMLESDLNGSEYLIRDENFDQIWNDFRRGFKTIPAAGGLVINQNGSILFIKRFGLWDLPKGKIEKNETAENAAIREVEEECGISGLSIIRPLESTFHIYRSPWLIKPDNLILKETHWFLMQYSGNEIPVGQKEEGIEDVCWIPAHELNQVLNHTYLNLKEFILQTMPFI